MTFLQRSCAIAAPAALVAAFGVVQAQSAGHL